jgi:hypothetical protein
VGDRPKSKNQDIEALLREAESRGWVFTKNPNGYYKGKCGCPGKHVKSVHLTPSDRRYVLNARKWFERTCWKDER